jgi:hypothetical protein
MGDKGDPCGMPVCILYSLDLNLLIAMLVLLALKKLAIYLIVLSSTFLFRKLWSSR